MTTHNDRENRRPLKVRSAKLSTLFAKWLSERNITPNQISIMSVVFAFLSATCFLLLPYVSGVSSVILIIFAAVFIQARLLCNLFDGMVAVEGGKGTPAGELFNDMPDRVADVLVITAVGYAIPDIAFASALAWLASILAVMTAYVRTLATSIGAPTNFSGPMAKQHRMAILTLACFVAAAESYLWSSQYSLLLALIIIVLGCIITLYKRTISAYKFLEKTS